MRNCIYLVIIILAFSGCSLIFEDDLSAESVFMIIPADSTQTIHQDQVFWWELLPEAKDYNLQIVEGEFSSPLGLVLDSMITEDKYEITLYPNSYQWRIKAMNQYSETAYTIGDICIIDTSTTVIDTTTVGLEEN